MAAPAMAAQPSLSADAHLQRGSWILSSAGGFVPGTTLFAPKNGFLVARTSPASLGSEFLYHSMLPFCSSSPSRIQSFGWRSKSNPFKNLISCQAGNSENENVASSQKNMTSGFSLTENKNLSKHKYSLPFASLNSSSSTAPPPPAQTYPGTPLMWVGLGVALTVTFSMVVKNVQARFQKFLMQKMFEQMQQGGMGGANPFNPGMPFPAPTPSSPTPSFTPPPFPPPPSNPFSQTPSPSGTSFKAAEPTFNSSPSVTPTPSTSEKETKTKTRKSAFVDVNVEEIKQQEASSPWQTSYQTPTPEPNSQTYAEFKQAEVVTDSGSYSGPNNGTGTKPKMSMEALEKLLEDPTIQKMIYPYLPEDMRDPTTFKWMLQNPIYRKQLEDMLNNMDGGQWDPRVFDMMKDFDMNSPDVQQQFASIGMKPEDVVAKIMANPEIAMAFQNPRLQAAIMDISANPMNISKYYADKEVMDIFAKLSALFPAVGTPPQF